MRLSAVILFVALLTISGLADRVNFVLINDTKTAILAFTIKPSASTEWDGDLLLHGKPLPPNEGDPYLCVDDTVSLLWDVRITTEDGAFHFFAINLQRTPLLHFRAWDDIGVWVLDLEGGGRPLPDLDGPVRDPFEPDEYEP